MLSSWKEIAQYLGVGVRTAQLWEHERGLPVHRLEGARGRVYASVEELDTWRGITPTPVAVPRRAYPSLVWVVALLVAIVGSWVLLARGWERPLSSVRVDQESLVGVDDRGGVLWRRSFGALRETAYHDGERRSWVGDLDGDGQPEVLFIPTPAANVPADVPLVCLDAHGRERWRYQPQDTIRIGSDSFGPPWVVRQFMVLDGRIVTTTHHHLYYPAHVSILDHRGRVLREYWHSGHLNTITTTKYDGRNVILAGGVNNARRLATMIVLDPATLDGAGEEEPAYRYHDKQRGVERRRIVFPRSRLPVTDPYNVAFRIFATTSEITVDVQEQPSDATPPSIQYRFNNDLTLRDVGFSDQYAARYHATIQSPLTDEIPRLHPITITH